MKRRFLAVAFAVAGCSLLACSTVAGASVAGGSGGGQPAPKRVPYVVGGEPLNTAPGWAALVLVVDGNTGYRCSGTVISPTAVLTAAHCVELDDGSIAKPGQAAALIGANDVTKEGDGAWSQVTKITVHPQRSIVLDGEFVKSSAYDLAVLTLAAPITTLPLPLVGDAAAGLTPGAMRAYGYGFVEAPSDANPTGTRSNVLRVSPLGSMLVVACDAQDAAIDHVCSTGPNPTQFGIGAGDSGGPWVRQIHGTYVQFGLTSYGVVGSPGDAVATAVPPVLPWIRANAGMLDVPAGTILSDTVSGNQWRIEPDGFRRQIPSAETLACLKAKGATVVEKPLLEIEQIPLATDGSVSCSAAEATTTTTTATTTSTSTTSTTTTTAVAAAAKTTTTVRTEVLSASANSGSVNTTGDAGLATTGNRPWALLGTALLLVGAGLGATALRVQRADD